MATWHLGGFRVYPALPSFTQHCPGLFASATLHISHLKLGALPSIGADCFEGKRRWAANYRTLADLRKRCCDSCCMCCQHADSCFTSCQHADSCFNSNCCTYWSILICRCHACCLLLLLLLLAAAAGCCDSCCARCCCAGSAVSTGLLFFGINPRSSPLGLRTASEKSSVGLIGLIV